VNDDYDFSELIEELVDADYYTEDPEPPPEPEDTDA